jgi:hypothetical protein
MKDKYTIKKDTNNGNVLVKNGIDTFCPYQSAIPVPIQSAMGGMSLNLVRMPCSTNCPFASIVSDTEEKNAIYNTSCNGDKTFILENNSEEKKDTPLIKMID